MKPNDNTSHICQNSIDHIQAVTELCCRLMSMLALLLPSAMFPVAQGTFLCALGRGLEAEAVFLSL